MFKGKGKGKDDNMSIDEMEEIVIKNRNKKLSGDKNNTGDESDIKSIKNPIIEYNNNNTNKPLRELPSNDSLNINNKDKEEIIRESSMRNNSKDKQAQGGDGLREMISVRDNELSDDDAYVLKILCLLAAFTGCIGPLIYWHLNKETSEFLNKKGKVIVNFSITIVGMHVVSYLLWTIFIGIFLTAAVSLYNIVILIFAYKEIKNGNEFELPFNLNIIK